MSEYGILSVIPPALSIFLAIMTRNIMLSIIMGAFSGTLILSNFNPFFAIAELVEEQAHCYWGTLSIGGPVLLEKEEMDEVLAAFVSYGQQEKRVDLVPGNKFD